MDSLAPVLAQSWQAAGHGAATPIWVHVMHGVALLATLVFLFLVYRAVRLGGRYRAVDVLVDADLAKVHDAIRGAEIHTVGEIVPVVLERSDAHPQGAAIAALLSTLVFSGAFAADLPWDHPPLVLAIQFAFGALGYAVASFLPHFRRLLVTEDRATEMAEEQAYQEFHRLGLQGTEARTGVLIFVSLFERRVVVLGDEGIHAKMGDRFWEGVDGAILDGIAKGSLRDGLIAGIELCGDVLAEHFPWTDGDRNELPDRVVVRAY